MVLPEDDLNKIKLMLIENNQELVKELKETFIEKSVMMKTVVIVALVSIGVSIPNIGSLVKLIF